MAKREPLKDVAYFENVRRYYANKVEAYNRDLETRPTEIKRWDIVHLFQCGNYFYLLRTDYSLGKSLEELIPVFDKVVEHWHAYHIFPGIEPGNKVLIDTYFEAVQFCALAILFRSGKNTISQLETVIRHLPHDQLLMRYTDFLQMDIAGKNKLRFKKTFEPLLSVFEQTDLKLKTAALKTYLENWLVLTKPLAYTGSHKIKVNDTAFAGYWSFESAAACVMEDLDPENFNNMAFFPGDLIEYYKKTIK